MKSINEIQAEILNDFKTEFDLVEIKTKSFLFVFSYVLATALYGLYYFIHQVRNNFFLDTTKDTKQIIRWGNTIGKERKRGSTAVGKVIASLTDSAINPSTAIPLETILTSPLGNEYQVIEVKQREQGEATEPTEATGEEEATENPVNGDDQGAREEAAKLVTLVIRSLAIGAINNLSAGNTLNFQSVLPGVTSVATVAEGGIVGGTDKESYEDYKLRLLQVLRSKRSGGSKEDYVNWVKEINGVFKVFVLEAYGGAGNVGISFILDDRTNIIPNDTKVKEVEKHLENNYRIIGSSLEVFKPIERKINLTITQLFPDTTQVRENIRKQLQELFKQEADLSGVVYRSKVDEAISQAEGEIRHNLVDCNDLRLAKNELATLGEITWQLPTSAVESNSPLEDENENEDEDDDEEGEESEANGGDEGNEDEGGAGGEGNENSDES